MAIYKRNLKGKGVSWCYLFSAPGATRENRAQIKKAGFATKKEATEAEAARRLELTIEAEAPAGGTPKTLGAVIQEWLKDRGSTFSPKTASRYAELAEVGIRFTQVGPTGCGSAVVFLEVGWTI